MAFPKQMKDIAYQLLQEPTMDSFREFLLNQTGEHNAIDFKEQWIEESKLAKEMIAMANSEGGIIVFGIAEQADHSAVAKGLDEIKDHATISNEIKKFISSDLKYDIYDYSYTTSEYAALEGRHFQMMTIENTPEHIPFMAKQDGTSIKKNIIYVRRGTSCEVANEEEIRTLINRRVNFIHPLNGEPLLLDEHLKQLKTLYSKINKENIYYRNSLPEGVSRVLSAISGLIGQGEKVCEPNPLYPDEDYDEFISRMIVEKKKKIERVLDLY